MTQTQADKNMLNALDELDHMARVTVPGMVLVAIKHNVDIDDLFEAWADE